MKQSGGKGKMASGQQAQGKGQRGIQSFFSAPPKKQAQEQKDMADKSEEHKHPEGEGADDSPGLVIKSGNKRKRLRQQAIEDSPEKSAKGEEGLEDDEQMDDAPAAGKGTVLEQQVPLVSPAGPSPATKRAQPAPEKPVPEGAGGVERGAGDEKAGPSTSQPNKAEGGGIHKPLAPIFLKGASEPTPPSPAAGDSKGKKAAPTPSSPRKSPKQAPGASPAGTTAKREDDESEARPPRPNSEAKGAQAGTANEGAKGDDSAKSATDAAGAAAAGGSEAAGSGSGAPGAAGGAPAVAGAAGGALGSGSTVPGAAGGGSSKAGKLAQPVSSKQPQASKKPLASKRSLASKQGGGKAGTSTGGGAAGVRGKGAGGGSAQGATATEGGEPGAEKEGVVSEEEDDEEDAISYTEEMEEDEEEQEQDAGDGKPVTRLKASDDTAAGKQGSKGVKKMSKQVASEVVNVGHGALETAMRACETDISKLVFWKAGQPVPYKFLADTFEAIAETTKRLTITSMLTNCLLAIMSTTPEDLLPTVYLCVNRVAPAHHGVELGVGESTLIKALAESTGRKDTLIKKQYEHEGDLGVVAVQSRSSQRTIFQTKPLSIRGVFQVFRDIAAASGQNSQERKKGYVIKLLAASKGNEAGYIMRSLQAKLRIGLAEQSVLVAIAHAASLHSDGLGKGKKDNGVGLAERLERAAQTVKQVYSECPSYDELIPALLKHGLWDLPQHCKFKPSVPIKPMLAKPTNGISEVLEKFKDQEFTCEYKYDGERAQIHLMDGGKKIMIFSRNSENMTPKYPDIVARLPGCLAPGVDSCVLDGEAVGWDPEHKKILPFQVLSTRARKDVSLEDIKVNVCVFLFDCLYLNGRSLLQSPLTERRQALYSAVKAKEGEVEFALAKTSRDIEELETFLNEAVDASTEGLIVKTLVDAYDPSKRSSHWLKLKKDYLEGVGDTFDVVPIGAWHGKGKRTGLYGAYLLAIYDADSESYQTISKLGTGFSEEKLAELTELLRPHVIPAPRRYYQWGETQEPDVWFAPVKVWEVKCADLSISPVHRAAQGLVDESKGISIRFPRLVRVREDKSPEDATSAHQVAEMYRMQAVVSKDKKGGAEDQEEEE